MALRAFLWGLSCVWCTWEEGREGGVCRGKSKCLFSPAVDLICCHAPVQDCLCGADPLPTSCTQTWHERTGIATQLFPVLFDGARICLPVLFVDCPQPELYLMFGWSLSYPRQPNIVCFNAGLMFGSARGRLQFHTAVSQCSCTIPFYSPCNLAQVLIVGSVSPSTSLAQYKPAQLITGVCLESRGIPEW